MVIVIPSWNKDMTIRRGGFGEVLLPEAEYLTRFLGNYPKYIPATPKPVTFDYEEVLFTVVPKKVDGFPGYIGSGRKWLLDDKWIQTEELVALMMAATRSGSPAHE